MNLRVSDNNLIEIKNDENNFMFDSNLCDILCIKFDRFSKFGNYSTNKPSNILLELHCNIVVKSISNHKENVNIHYEEDLLFIFNNPQDNLIIKPTTITYMPVIQKKIKIIRLNNF